MDNGLEQTIYLIWISNYQTTQQSSKPACTAAQYLGIYTHTEREREHMCSLIFLSALTIKNPGNLCFLCLTSYLKAVAMVSRFVLFCLERCIHTAIFVGQEERKEVTAE